MTDYRLNRAPGTNAEAFREVARRVARNERTQTCRFGEWVGTEVDGRPVLVKPGEQVMDAGVAPTPDVIALSPSDSPFSTPLLDWSMLNLGDEGEDDSAVLSTDGDALVLTAPSVATTEVRGLYQPLPLDVTDNYTVTAHIEAAMVNAGTVRAGIMLREEATGEMVIHGPLFSTGFQLAATKFASVTSASTAYASATTPNLLYGMPYWLRMSDDGTNRIFEYSYNMVEWIQLGDPVGRTDYLTPDQVGVALVNTGSGHPAVLRLNSFRVG